MNKFQKELAKLRKENKFTTKQYHHDFTELLKPTNQKKNYPMRTIVSTIGTAPYGTSKYFVEIIQPTLNKNKHRLMNSSSFVNEAATWETTQEEIQVSYDVINLYPLYP